MSLTCLNNIVTLGVCDDEETPLSGLTLMDAPEISSTNLANIATEKDISGKALATRILTNAHTLLRNDILTVMASNKMLLDYTARQYETTKFIPTTTIEASALERGLTLYKADDKWRKSLKKLTINYIRVFPLTTKNDVTFYIHDSGLTQAITSTYSFDLVADEINSFQVDYQVLGEYATISMVDSDVSLATAYLELCAGCSGRKPNDCGYTKSFYDGRSTSGREGYGIGALFTCECDYDVLLCNLAKSTLGKLIWQKARIMVMQEHLSSNRTNNWVIYNRDELKEYHIPKLEQEYENDYKGFIASLKTLAAQYSGECITCNGIKSVVSV